MHDESIAFTLLVHNTFKTTKHSHSINPIFELNKPITILHKLLIIFWSMQYFKP